MNLASALHKCKLVKNTFNVLPKACVRTLQRRTHRSVITSKNKTRNFARQWAQHGAFRQLVIKCYRDLKMKSTEIKQPSQTFFTVNLTYDKSIDEEQNQSLEPNFESSHSNIFTSIHKQKLPKDTDHAANNSHANSPTQSAYMKIFA